MSRSAGLTGGLAARVTIIAMALLGLVFASSPTYAAEPFSAWLAGLRAEALRSGISPAAVRAGLGHAYLMPEVMARDRHQPELTLTFQRYRKLVVSPERIAEGRRQLAAHRAILQRVSRRYGVPAALIVALWGIESSYGAHTGQFPVVPALITLAYEGHGPRARYFRGQVLYALRIIAREGMPAVTLRGSWAGAMGQNQFMPSTYWHYAVHFAGAGAPNIWTSKADVFASAANYLSQVGWRRGAGWGVPVRLLRPVDPAEIGDDVNRPLSAWRRIGVRPLAGHRFPPWLERRAALVLPQGAKGPAFLVGPNFRALMNWNRSAFFGISAGLLADRIGRR